ncbi:MAG: Holliday junction resolvase RuvX [Phycisphaerales bacterium]|nr:Holliday junction resolvase RuvX [Phycisphaerales bacterium]
MRYLAIDLGDKRTGMALGDAITRAALPAGVIEVPADRRNGEALLDALCEAVQTHLGATGELVIGLPLNMDGTQGPRAKGAIAMGERLAARTRLKVHYQDERLSTASADWSMARSGLTRGQKKARRDAIAAAEILREFLAGLPGTQSPDDAKE